MQQSTTAPIPILLQCVQGLATSGHAAKKNSGLTVGNIRQWTKLCQGPAPTSLQVLLGTPGLSLAQDPPCIGSSGYFPPFHQSRRWAVSFWLALSRTLQLHEPAPSTHGLPLVPLPNSPSIVTCAILHAFAVSRDLFLPADRACQRTDRWPCPPWLLRLKTARFLPIPVFTLRFPPLSNTSTLHSLS